MKTLCSKLALTLLSSASSVKIALVVTLEVIRSTEASIVGSAGSSVEAPTLAARSERINWWILNSRLNDIYQSWEARKYQDEAYPSIARQRPLDQLVGRLKVGSTGARLISWSGDSGPVRSALSLDRSTSAK